MAKKRKMKKVPLYKNVGFYFVLVYALLTLALIVQIFTVDIIPMKYAIPGTVVLVLLLILMYFLELGKKVNKVNKILGKILIVLFSAILAYGNWNLYKTGSVFTKISGDNTETTVISVVVMNKNKDKTIKDLANSNFGVTQTGDQNMLNKAYADIKKDTKQDITTVKYKSYKTIGDDLYSGKVDAVILDEGTRGLFEDNHPKFNSETHVVKSYEYKKETKDISKNVKVTEEPFNVYITGIDVYGGISTVSRSDVNMIVTVNPKTKQILMTSIPRDYYVPQPCQNNQKDKLTHTGIFGVECTVSTAENYFKIPINYYLRINFSSVEKIVDAIGGINVDNPVAFTASDNTYSYAAGNIHLDGKQALRFARERYNLADGDRDRGRNQMRVFTGIINQAISPSIITNYSSIMSAVGDSFQTNMSASEMSSLVKMQLNDMSGWDIEQVAVNGTGVASAWSPANGFNAWVMEPNVDTVKRAVDVIKRVKDGENVKDLAKKVNAENAAAE